MPLSQRRPSCACATRCPPLSHSLPLQFSFPCCSVPPRRNHTRLTSSTGSNPPQPALTVKHKSRRLLCASPLTRIHLSGAGCRFTLEPIDVNLLLQHWPQICRTDTLGTIVKEVMPPVRGKRCTLGGQYKASINLRAHNDGLPQAIDNSLNGLPTPMPSHLPPSKDWALKIYLPP